MQIRENIHDPLYFGLFVLAIFLLVKIVFPNSDYIDTALNALLVFYTIIYVSVTYKILKDGQKAREIEFIQKQLESFYYPWLSVMEEVENAYLNMHLEDEDIFYMQCLDKLTPIIKKGNLELHKYLYLTDEDIRGRLLQIEQYLGFKRMEIDPGRMMNVTGIPQDDTQNYLDFIPPDLLYYEQEYIFNNVISFKSDIESEIKRLNNRLIGLIK